MWSGAAQRQESQFILTIFVCVAVLAWMVLLTQGLPIGDPDDWDHILISQDTSWWVLARNFFMPWSSSRNWVAQTDLIDQTIGSRLFHGIALKSVITFFDHQFFPFYFFNKTIFFAGTVTFLFLLLQKLTKSPLLSMGGIIFYTLVPAHYAHLLWNSVPETMVHFFVIASVFAFLQVAEAIDKNQRNWVFWNGLAWMLIAGWFAVKTKETGIILPLVLGTYTCIQAFRWRHNKLSLLIVFAVIIFIGFLVIPIEHFEVSKEEFRRTFHWDTFVRMLLRNYDCGYDNESTTAFFSREQVFPVSIARTIGFYSLWAIVFSFVLYIKQRVSRPPSSRLSYFNGHLIGLAFVWVAIELFLIGFFQPDPRYFSGTMIPLTILIVRLFHVVIRNAGRFMKYFLIAAISFSFAMTVYVNFQHVIWLRQQIGKRSHRFYHMAETIFKDAFPNNAPTRRNIGLSYCPTYVPDPAHPRLRDVTYYVTLDYNALNKTRTPSLSDYQASARRGAVYFMTDQPGMLEGDPNIRMIKMISGINEKSLLEQLIYPLKKKKPVPYYIFKYVL